MRMLKLTITSVVLALVLTIPAMANDKISLGGSAGDLYFCSTGNGYIAVAATSFGDTTTCTGAAAGTVTGNGAHFQAPSGTDVFGGSFSIGFPIGPTLIIGPGDPSGLFSTNGATSSFSFNGGTNGQLAGTITWNFVADHTNNPRFDGNLLITSVSGSNPIFTGDYPLGNTVHIDFTMDFLPNWLDTIATSGGSEASQISSGEINAAPEVSSVLLLGTGMLLAGTFVRYRRRQQA